MKTKICIVCALLLLLTGCSSNLSTSDIRDDIPEEISQLYSANNSFPMDLDDIEIVQSKTEDRQKTLECMFNFSDEYAECTTYWTLFYYQYDDGTWKLEHWERTKETEARPLQGPSDADIDEVIQYVSSCLYNPTYTGIDVDLEADTPSAVMHFDVNNSFGYMSESGTLDVLWNFSRESVSWEYSFDNSNLTRSWNVENAEASRAYFGTIVDNYALGFTVELSVDNRFFTQLNGTDNIKYDVGNIFSFQCEAGKIADIFPSEEYSVLKQQMTYSSDAELLQQFMNDQCLATWSYPQYLNQDGYWDWHGTLWHRIYICDNAIYYSCVGLDDDGKHYWNGDVTQIAHN